MGYTVRKAAELTGLSVQAIYQRINKLSDEERAELIQLDSKGSKLLSETFVNQLQQGGEIAPDQISFAELQQEIELMKAREQGRAEERERLDPEIKRLQAEIETLQAQINHLIQVNSQNQLLLLQAQNTINAANSKRRGVFGLLDKITKHDKNNEGSGIDDR